MQQCFVYRESALKAVDKITDCRMKRTKALLGNTYPLSSGHRH
jgi:hypothetical protein